MFSDLFYSFPQTIIKHMLTFFSNCRYADAPKHRHNSSNNNNIIWKMHAPIARANRVSAKRKRRRKDANYRNEDHNNMVSTT